MKLDEDIVLIAGPTASGKTGLAINLAQTDDYVIINADSMQIYRDLRIITARPSPEEEQAATHLLFGYVDAAVNYSVAQWLSEVEGVLSEHLGSGRKVIFVGGTGLYFKALIEGLSPIPEIDPDIRDKWRLMDDKSSDELHLILREMDPRAAENLQPGDRQRVTRALEVKETTGRSIVDWQKEKGSSILPESASVAKLLLMPDRKVLHERINTRFEAMVHEGGLEEVKTLLARNLDRSLPAMKAIGVPHLARYLEQKEPLDQAIDKAKAATRQYAKRQSTWFRNSFDDTWLLTR